MQQFEMLLVWVLTFANLLGGQRSEDDRCRMVLAAATAVVRESTLSGCCTESGSLVDRRVLVRAMTPKGALDDVSGAQVAVPVVAEGKWCQNRFVEVYQKGRWKSRVAPKWVLSLDVEETRTSGVFRFGAALEGFPREFNVGSMALCGTVEGVVAKKGKVWTATITQDL
jgi:hypothetical protein